MNTLISLFTGGKATAVFIFIILLQVGVSYGLYQRSESLQTTLAYELTKLEAIEANLKSSQESIVTLNNRIKASKIASQEFSEANKVIKEEYNKLEAEYKKYLGRDSVIQKKPTLVNKRINKSFNTFIREVSCNSGVETSCIKD